MATLDLASLHLSAILLLVLLVVLEVGVLGADGPGDLLGHLLGHHVALVLLDVFALLQMDGA